MPNGDSEFSQRIWSVILKIMVPLTLGYIGWSLAQVVENERSIAVMQAEQFTIEDAQILERRMDGRYELIQDKIGKITTDVAVIRQILEGLTGTELFADEIYFLSQLPAVIEWKEVGTVVGMAFILSFGATIYPAMRASRLDPVEALRYE